MSRSSPVQHYSRRSVRQRAPAGFREIEERWGQLGKQDVEFWKAHLVGAPELLELPTDRPRPTVLSYAAGSVDFEIDAALTTALRTLTQRHGATLSITLFAAWAALLSRLSGQNDIVIGTPIASRSRPDSPTSSISFGNVFALRVRFEGDPTVSELLAQIMATTMAAYEHRDVTFAQIVEALQTPRSLSHNPIFQVMLTLDNMPADRELRLPGLRVGDAGPVNALAQFDLALALNDTGTTLAGTINYASELFDELRIERIASHLRSLLVSVAGDDRQRISELVQLTGVERQLVLNEWNATDADFPRGTVPQLFAAQVARTPQQMAVSDGTRALSYAELDRVSDPLAVELQSRGVGLESVVVVLLNRSLESVVAAMAILKAGGVYLPVDPVIPEQRLAFIISDAQAVLAITDDTQGARLPPHVPQVRIDLRQPHRSPQSTRAAPDSLAYIVYTSGSTGNPKGVAVSHASAVNLAFARARGHDPIGPGDRILAAISVGFDVSIGQLLLPLLSGASIVIAPDLRSLSPESFWALLAEQQVSHVNSVPSFFESVLDAAGQQPGLALKRLMLGGEALSGALCWRLQAALPNTVVINMYGPTEACIDATSFVVPEGVDPAMAVLPIGRPLANYRAYVLDARLRPQPPGIAGELYLGGPGLARGYVGQPGLTASRFIADPFGPPGSRLYATGDRALWRNDGTLMFLGRNDEQVKIRGFRVEPGEIVAALRLHAGVTQAAVVPRGERETLKLVAYIVPKGTAPTAAELRRHVARYVPPHMVPAAFVMLDVLPLTTNGKIDRAALPEPGIICNSVYEPPTNLAEASIAHMFQDLLGVARVGRQDSFFELGGHSLLVLRLAAALRAEFGRPIPMARVFRAPTPAQLAAVMAELPERNDWRHLVALNEGGPRRPLFCLNGYDGDVDAYLHIARFVEGSIPVYGLEIVSSAADADYQETLESRMESYQQELRSVQPKGPYHLCGFSFGGAEAFDLACRLEQAGEDVVLILLDAYRPSRWLEFASGPPRLLRLLQSGQLLRSAQRQLRKLVSVREHRWLTGKDRDLEQALRRNAIVRKVQPFHGHVILFKSIGIEDWGFQLRLDGYNGWKRYLAGPCDVISMAVPHNDLMREPTVQSVVRHIDNLVCEEYAG